MSLKQTTLGDLDQEFAKTRAMLERVSDAYLDFRPYEGAWSVRELCAHIASLAFWETMTLQTQSVDLAALPAQQPDVPDTAAGLLADFDAKLAAFRAALDAADDAALAQTWTLLRGGQQIFAMPRAVVIRTTGINHLIHHRAQLGMYLRLAGQKPAAMYGPTAEDMPT
jgi:uncharacterized damage-inducible protein DinB